MTPIAESARSISIDDILNLAMKYWTKSTLHSRNLLWKKSEFFHISKKNRFSGDYYGRKLMTIDISTTTLDLWQKHKKIDNHSKGILGKNLSCKLLFFYQMQFFAWRRRRNNLASLVTGHETYPIAFGTVFEWQILKTKKKNRDEMNQ